MIVNLDYYFFVCQLGIIVIFLGLGWFGELMFEKLLYLIFEVINLLIVLIMMILFVVLFIIVMYLYVVFGELVFKFIVI